MKRKDTVVGQNTKGIEFLFKKNKIEWAKGRGTLKPGNVVEVEGDDGTSPYQAKNVIIATGSVPIELPFLKFDEERVLSNVGALTIPEVPKHLIVIGGGVIGLELGSVWRRLGAKVTVVELFPTILPGNDEEIIKEADKIFRKQGLEIRTGTKVVGASRADDIVKVEIEKDGAKETLEADYVLVSVGRKPSLTGIDAAALGLTLGKRGEIAVDAQMRTNLPNVYAIGDAVGGKLLAHKAEEEGVIAAEVIAGHHAHMDYRSMPSVVYTWPEIATRRPGRARGESIGPRIQDRQVSFLRERPRAHDGGDERLREVHRRREDRRAARLPHHRRQRVGSHPGSRAGVRVSRIVGGHRHHRALAPDALRDCKGGRARRARQVTTYIGSSPKCSLPPSSDLKFARRAKQISPRR